MLTAKSFLQDLELASPDVKYNDDLFPNKSHISMSSDKRPIIFIGNSPCL
jgi:hypothetical protein